MNEKIEREELTKELQILNKLLAILVKQNSEKHYISNMGRADLDEFLDWVLAGVD